MQCINAAVASDLVVVDRKRAATLGRASYIVSGIGVLVTIVTIAIVVGVVVGSASSSSSSSASTCSYYMNGVCYSYRSYSYLDSECYYTYFGYYNSIDGYCYYNH